MSVATEQSPISKTWNGPPPPAELTTNASSSLQLLSQGAEARVWLVTLPDNATKNGSNNVGGSSGMRSINVGSGISVPQLLSFSQQPSPLSLYRSATNTASSDSMKFICKERFPKKYRHPQLDVSLTKSRTKSEARSLIRCRRADIPCPDVLAIAQWSNKQDAGNGSMHSGKGESNITNTSTTSSCLFLECVEGITVREYLEQQSAAPRNNQTKGADEGSEPKMKRARSEDTDTSTVPDKFQREERITTVIDTHTLCVAHTIGTIVAKMHAAGVVHGDLTTSNIMVRTPPASSGELDTAWKPQLVLIDFGLATSTSSLTNNKTNNASSNKKAKPHKIQHNAEEKAVDLYVLERAFLSTHPESELLVEEVWKGYRGYFEGLDCDKSDDMVAGDAKKGDMTAVSSCSSRGGDESVHGHVAKAVLDRLEKVRMRGRKRECFG